MHNDEFSSLKISGRFDTAFITQVGNAIDQIARASGKDVHAHKLTPNHVLLVLIDIDGDKPPRPDPVTPIAGPDVEQQCDVDGLVQQC